jgi:hypothetical protein
VQISGSAVAVLAFQPPIEPELPAPAVSAVAGRTALPRPVRADAGVHKGGLPRARIPGPLAVRAAPQPAYSRGPIQGPVPVRSYANSLFTSFEVVKSIR